jgi:hypothetical protein
VRTALTKFDSAGTAMAAVAAICGTATAVDSEIAGTLIAPMAAILGGDGLRGETDDTVGGVSRAVAAIRGTEAAVLTSAHQPVTLATEAGLVSIREHGL